MYVYCRNNPLTYVDYFGLASEKNKGPVDESYFYGEYEPHCYCERHRDCKRGGDIATNPTLRAGVSIGSVVDLSLEVLSHPRVQGSMQAFAGLAEASAGGLATLSSGALAAPVGWPVLVHGLDQFITGMSISITGKHRATLTEQLLQTTGMSSEWTSFTNDVLTIGGTMGAGAAWKAGILGGYSKASLLKKVSYVRGEEVPYNFATEAGVHMTESYRRVPLPLIERIIQSPITVTTDPRKSSKALMYYSRIWKNGRIYNMEVLYDSKSNSIMHFRYTQKAIGPLDRIPKSGR